MSSARRLLLAATAAVVLLATAACSDAAGPSKDQYVAMADGVCKATDEKLTQLYEDYEVMKFEAAAKGETPVYVDRPERWVRVKVVAEYRRMSGGLRGIQPPDGDAAYVADIYADLDERIDVLHNHPSEGRAVIEGDAELRERFTSYGMKECPGPDPAEATDEAPLPTLPEGTPGTDPG